MKNLIKSTIAGVSMLAVGASCYGQGSLTFANTAATAITFGAGAPVQAPSPGSKMFGTASLYTFGLYVGAAGDTSFSQLTLIDTVGNPNTVATSFNTGLFASGTLVTGQGNVGAANGFAGLVGNTTYVIAVAAWTTADGSSLAAALTANDPNGLTGTSGLGSITAASGSSGVPDVFGTAGGGGGLTGFTLNPVPEPTTIALGGLGAAALLFFRRRK